MCLDTRPTADQAALFDTARRLVADLGPNTVAELDDDDRRARLRRALAETGVHDLRDAGEGRAPVASGVEAALVAQALGHGPADVAYLGRLLAGDLRRRAGGGPDGIARTVALTADLLGPATARDGHLVAEAVAIDADAAERALLVTPDGAGYRLVEVDLGATVEIGTDLTRRQLRLAAGTDVTPLDLEPVGPADLVGWTALGLAISTADAVGAMQGGIALAVDYASHRQQYGANVGSFQAVQHLLAEAHALAEGSLSISRHAAWAVDALEPFEARSATQAATVYAARAARTVGETVIQVHGGIGNTWECMAHVFLRRSLHDAALLGGAGQHLAALARERTGAAHGVS